MTHFYISLVQVYSRNRFTTFPVSSLRPANFLPSLSRRACVWNTNIAYTDSTSTACQWWFWTSRVWHSVYHCLSTQLLGSRRQYKTRTYSHAKRENIGYCDVCANFLCREEICWNNLCLLWYLILIMAAINI